MIYVILLLLMFVCVYKFDLLHHKQFNNLSYWLFCIALIIVAGLRYRLGGDSVVYELDYENIPRFWELGKYKFSSVRYEPGFIFLESITKSISSDFTLFQFFHATIVNIVIFFFIKNNTIHKFTCLTFYFIILYLNLNCQVLRESLAVACFLLSWPYFRDGKWIGYYLLILLGSTFHTSAFLLFLLPLGCLPGVKSLFLFGKRTIVICLVVLALGIFIQTRFSAVFSIMAVTERIMDRVNSYSRDEMSGSMLNLMGFIGMTIQYILYPLIALYFANQKMGRGGLFRKVKKNPVRELSNPFKEDSHKRKLYEIEKRKENKVFDRWQFLVLVGIYFMVFSMPMFIFRRYFNYFGMFALATVATWLFSKIYYNRKVYKLKLAYWIIIIFPFYFMNLYFYNANANKSGTLKTYMIYYPYYHRLDPQMDQNRENIYRYITH